MPTILFTRHLLHTYMYYRHMGIQKLFSYLIVVSKITWKCTPGRRWFASTDTDRMNERIESRGGVTQRVKLCSYRVVSLDNRVANCQTGSSFRRRGRHRRLRAARSTWPGLWDSWRLGEAASRRPRCRIKHWTFYDMDYSLKVLFVYKEFCDYESGALNFWRRLIFSSCF